MRTSKLVQTITLVIVAFGSAARDAKAQEGATGVGNDRAGTDPVPEAPVERQAAPYPPLQQPPEPAKLSSKVEWSPLWPEFTVGEYVATGTLLLGTGAIILFGKEGEANWRGPILFDKATRDGLRANSAGVRQNAQRVSDGFYYGGLAYPYLVDVVAVAWLGHGAPEVAAQMALMDTEAFAIAGLLSFVSNATIRRQRSYVEACDPNKPDPVFPACDSDGQAEGFFSGHTAIAFTGAALSCMHHANLPLYGESGVGGTVACVSSMAGATSVGVLRIVADKHYASDVIVGSAVGIASGALVPWFHYRGGAAESAKPAAQGLSLRWMPAPMLSSTVAGVAAMGVF